MCGNYHYSPPQTEDDDGDSDSYIGSQETGDELGGVDYRPARSLVSSCTGSQTDPTPSDTDISTRLNWAN